MLNIIKKFFRDPIWQSVGVIVATIPVIYLLTNQNQLNGKLEIIKVESVKFEDYLLPSNLVKLNIGESIENTENTIVEYYLLKNKGEKPILPSDYIAPISIENSPNENILLVESCSKINVKNITENLSETCEVTDWDNQNWTKKNNIWTVTPSLLNPEEYICAIVIKKLLQSEKPLNPNSKWKGRIAGVKINVYNSYEAYKEKTKFKFTDYIRNRE